MYIWCAIDLDDQMTALKEEVRRISEELSIDNFALRLPFHVSMRISFEIPDEREEEVKSAMRDFFSNRRRFRFEPLCLERNANVVWVRMKDNPKLTNVHNGLCSMLEERFGVPLMEFDKCFIFHSTLVWTKDDEEAEKAYQLLKDVNLPQSLKARTYVVGRAITGKPGDFKVVERGECVDEEDQDDYLM